MTSAMQHRQVVAGIFYAASFVLVGGIAAMVSLDVIWILG